VLDIDDLVAAHAPFALADEIAAAPITVEHLLSHRSGLPNLFGTGLLRVHVPPGRRFSYSSVGYAYLQRAIEAVTGEPLEATVRRRVLEPLGMRDSSLIWQRRFEANHAVPHEGGVPLDKHRPPVASASYSLQTTAGDYARFVAATIAGTGLSEAAHTRWLAPCVAVPDGRAEDLSEDEVPAASGPLVDEVLPRDHPAVGGGCIRASQSEPVALRSRDGTDRAALQRQRPSSRKPRPPTQHVRMPLRIRLDLHHPRGVQRHRHVGDREPVGRDSCAASRRSPTAPRTRRASAKS